MTSLPMMRGAFSKTLVPYEREVLTIGGKWRLVRLLPYRTSQNTIEGVVITFLDVDRVKARELLRHPSLRGKHRPTCASRSWFWTGAPVDDCEPRVFAYVRLVRTGSVGQLLFESRNDFFARRACASSCST